MMRNLKKLLSLALALALIVTLPVNAAGIQPYAWPGRPGGTGTGSEEWLQGEYGEDNGVWKHVNSLRGSIDDLNVPRERISMVCVPILTGFKGMIGSAVIEFLTQGMISDALASTNYEGNYYVLNSYWSGRCMKIVISTYNNDNYTSYVKTYTEWVKW